MHASICDSSTSLCMGNGTQVTVKVCLPLVLMINWFLFMWFRMFGIESFYNEIVCLMHVSRNK